MKKSIEQLAQNFTSFMTMFEKTPSALYETLTVKIADDPEILEISSVTREGQIVPLMVYGAVRYLLMADGNTHELCHFFADMVADGQVLRSPDKVYPSFRAFCLEHKAEIRDLLSTRLVQTNEVLRCAVMIPAFGLVADNTKQALTLLELGSSIGLNLNWDKYHYHYTGIMDSFTGDDSSPLHLAIEVKGDKTPPIPKIFPNVIERKGIDLNPLDPTNEAVVRWLRALIWSEQLERGKRFEQAIQVLQTNPPQVIGGDALALLPEQLAGMSSDGALCIVHSMVVVYFSEQMRQQLHATLLEYSHNRPIFRISYEWEPVMANGALRLITYDKGTVANRLLAEADSYARWIIWRDE